MSQCVLLDVHAAPLVGHDCACVDGTLKGATVRAYILKFVWSWGVINDVCATTHAGYDCACGRHPQGVCVCVCVCARARTHTYVSADVCACTCIHAHVCVHWLLLAGYMTVHVDSALKVRA